MKHTVFTTVTPLPSTVTRETVLETLHNHSEMIELNPLVIKHEQCKPPKEAQPDEFHATWYEVTDSISYIPGLVTGKLSFKVCFHDLPFGLQTHVYAPTGLDIKDKWSVGGNMPGEPRETLELGLNAPREGLYLREDVDMRCNVFATGFVKKTLKKAHGVLVDRLVVKADLADDRAQRASYAQQAQSQQYNGSIRSRDSVSSGHAPSALSPRSLQQKFASPQPSPGFPPDSARQSGVSFAGPGQLPIPEDAAELPARETAPPAEMGGGEGAGMK